MDGLNTNLTGAALTQAMLVFLTMLPTASDLHDMSPADAKQIRVQQSAAATIALSVGFGLSVIAKQSAPFLASLAVTVAALSASTYLVAIPATNERN